MGCLDHYWLRNLLVGTPFTWLLHLWCNTEGRKGIYLFCVLRSSASVLGYRLDYLILEVFSNLNGSVILCRTHSTLLSVVVSGIRPCSLRKVLLSYVFGGIPVLSLSWLLLNVQSLHKFLSYQTCAQLHFAKDLFNQWKAAVCDEPVSHSLSLE